MFGRMMKRDDALSGSMASTTAEAPSMSISAAQKWINSLEQTGASYNRHSSGDRNHNHGKRSSSGLATALNDIVKVVNDYVDSGAWKNDLQWFLWNVVLPVLVTLLVFAGTIYLLQKLYRYFVPYTAEELHKNAIQTLMPLKHSDPDNSKRQIARTEREAETMLEQALERDRSYTPAWISLAALHVYRQEQPGKALDLLRTRKQQVGKLDPELKQIQEDAKAMQEGHKAMIQKDIAETEYLSFLSALGDKH